MSGGLLAPMAQMTVARAAGKQMARIASVIAVLAVLFLPADRDETRPRALDGVGLLLLSPGLILLLLGADCNDSFGGGSMLSAWMAMLIAYGVWARRKKGTALVDLRLFRNTPCATATGAMFLVNGVTFAGQMLIPLFLTTARGLSPAETCWLMMPLGAGMICTYPFVGRLTERLGPRTVASAGAGLALAATLPLVLLARSDLSVPLLLATMFAHGVGMGAFGVPSNSSRYTAIPREDQPTAATAMNIGQRIGGSTWTTVCAAFLAWRTAASPAGAFPATFLLLSGIHVALLATAARLPGSAR